MLIAVCILYLILPTQNANIDSWYYAACVKYGNELINSHHLLYNVLGYLWFEFLKLFYKNMEAIQALNAMNALAASISLFIFYKTLILLRQTAQSALSLAFFSGVCFGFFRFATDAETYILPILFSIASTYFYIRNKKSDIFFVAFFSLLAICTHQLHIWWTIAIALHLLFYRKKYVLFILFSLSILCVLPIYFLAFQILDAPNLSFIQFISGEYVKGNAGIDISLNSFILTSINLIRSFIQIHGQIIPLFSNYPFGVVLIVSIILFIIFHFHKKNRLNLKITRKIDEDNLSFLFAIALFLHLVFAFFSSGNAEFMAMIPFLLIGWLGSFLDFRSIRLILPLGLIILVWNMGTGILPNAFTDIVKSERQINISQNSASYCLWKNRPLIENRLTYLEGFKERRFLIKADELDSLVQSGHKIFTDYGNENGTVSRESFIKKKAFNLDSSKYSIQTIDSFMNLNGKNYIRLIAKKQENSIFAP